MRRIGLEQCERRAERDRLRHQLVGTYSSFVCPFGDLPNGAPCGLARGEERDRSAVEFGGAYQFESQLEGWEPQAEGLATSRSPVEGGCVGEPSGGFVGGEGFEGGEA